MEYPAEKTDTPFAGQYVRHLLSAMFHATITGAVIACITAAVSLAYIVHHLVIDATTPVMLPFAICMLVGGYVGIAVFRAEIRGDQIPRKHRRLIIWLSVVYWNLVLTISIGLAILFGSLIPGGLTFAVVGLTYAMLEATLAPKKLSLAAWISVILVAVAVFIALIIKGDEELYEGRGRDAVGLIRRQPAQVVRGVPHPGHLLA